MGGNAQVLLHELRCCVDMRWAGAKTGSPAMISRHFCL